MTSDYNEAGMIAIFFFFLNMSDILNVFLSVAVLLSLSLFSYLSLSPVIPV